jgi:hypothetical protein
MKNELLAAYRYISNNWPQIQASSVCGCCNCLRVFPAEEVVAWTGLQFDDVDNPEAINNQTALCPYCGSESVLAEKSGFPIDVNFLGRMNEAWFQKTIIRKPAPKA